MADPEEPQGPPPQAPQPNRKLCKPKPREYKDGEDFNQYLNHFNRVATANEWSNEIKLVQLETVLKGRAQMEFEIFIEENPDITWDTMVKNLKEELGPSVQKSLDNFSTLKMGNMSPKEFYAALVKLSKLAHGDMTNEARHVIVRAQLLQAIPKKLRTDAGKQCYLSDLEKEELLKILTRVYDAELREESTAEETYEPMVCRAQASYKDNDSRMKELERDMAEMKSMMSKICKGFDESNYNYSTGNRQQPRRGQSDFSSVTCYKCQQKGHFARSCENTRACLKCKKDHAYANCPENPKNS